MSSNQVRNLIIALIAVMAVAIGVVWWLSSKPDPVHPEVKPAPVPVAQVAPAPEPSLEPELPKAEPEPVAEPDVLSEPEPVIEPEPVVEPVEPKLFDFKLPELDDSDKTLLQQLKTKIAVESLSLLVDEGVIERFVVTTDAIARDEVPYNLLPVDRPTGSYKVIEAQETLFASTANIARYQPYLDLMAAMPRDHWLAFYEHTYPLMQQAYDRLGYPEQSFHQVLLEAIENLLATPKPSAAMALVQPNVMYEYADPELQQGASPVEKLMLRLGPDINGKLKGLLKGLQQGLKQKEL